jgi:hypothetical protein
MFNPQAALRRLDGKSFDYPKPPAEPKKIRFQHIEVIPPEFDINDLFLLALRQKWLKKTDHGRFTACVQD